MSEASETVDIVNSRGLHARASAKFVTAVGRLCDQLQVEVEKDGTRVNGQSIMGLMMLGAARGSTVTLHVRGPEGEQERVERALAKLAGLFKDGFGED